MALYDMLAWKLNPREIHSYIGNQVLRAEDDADTMTWIRLTPWEGEDEQ
nr:MAG TPA: hypothetical protein [Caudoviricetes sp.]